MARPWYEEPPTAYLFPLSHSLHGSPSLPDGQRSLTGPVSLDLRENPFFSRLLRHSIELILPVTREPGQRWSGCFERVENSPGIRKVNSACKFWQMTLYPAPVVLWLRGSVGERFVCLAPIGKWRNQRRVRPGFSGSPRRPIQLVRLDIFCC